MSEYLDRWVSVNIRNEIEQRFYAKVNEQADGNQLIHDPDFMAAPNKHVGLFSDHGIVHTRDVASQVIDVLANCHGVLIPRRDAQRFSLMQGYGILLAYFHDIGMVDFSRFGRAMHPEFAAQAVFDPALDDLIDSIWRENSGGLAWYLRRLVDKGLISQDPKLVLREMLSLSIGHSKSKIPITTLNDRRKLQACLLEIISTDLHTLYAKQQIGDQVLAQDELAILDGRSKANPFIHRFSRPYPHGAYGWLIDGTQQLLELADDVIDTVRALRAADALRQRGTVLKTSGNYQIYVNQQSASAVYALKLGKDQSYLLELSNPISAGEANLASSELEKSGDLRISFHRGSFREPGANELAARNAALVVYGIQRDVLESFRRKTNSHFLKQESETFLYLEETEDNSSFTRMVKNELIALDPDFAKRVRSTPSLKNVHPVERERYLASKALTWDLPARRDLIARMGQAGYPSERIDLEQAFRNVRLVALEAGEVLVEAGAPSAFVYLPLDPGLKIVRLGGYDPVSVEPWMLLGETGVVRGGERNATILAERWLQVLMIAKSIYLTHWHHTLSLEEFQEAVERLEVESSRAPGSLSQLEKSLLLQSVPLFKTLDQQAYVNIASRVTELRVAAGDLVIEKGSFGRSLYVVVEGSLDAHDGGLVLSPFGPGDVFGEMAAITPGLRTATVTATANSLLLRLSQTDLKYLIENYTAVAGGIIEVLAGYVRDQTTDLKETNGQLDE